VPELFSVNTPGATEATGSVTGSESAPKYSICTWLGGTFLVSAGSVLLTSTLEHGEKRRRSHVEWFDTWWRSFMTSVKDKKRLIRVSVVSIALSITLASVSASFERLSAQDQKASGAMYYPKRMADGKEWTTHNLDVSSVPSYCYEDVELNCSRYGRLYTWESARRACRSLEDGWRLPTDNEWRQMAKHYGGVSEDSDDRGKAAYRALFVGGSSGFNALLGGGRSDDGQYARLEAHAGRWRSDGHRKSGRARRNPLRGLPQHVKMDRGWSRLTRAAFPRSFASNLIASGRDASPSRERFHYRSPGSN